MPDPTLQTVVIIHPGDNVDTEDLFAAACREHPYGKIEQNASGDIVVMAPTGGESAYQNIEIARQLQDWAKRDGRGRAFDSNALFILPDKSKRSPDASWVHVDKLRKLPKHARREFLPLVPDYTLRAAVTHRFSLRSASVEVTLSGRYLGAARLSFDPELDFPLGNMLESNMEASIALPSMKITAILSNLFGDRAETLPYGSPLRILVMRQFTPAKPTAISLTAARRF